MSSPKARGPNVGRNTWKPSSSSVLCVIGKALSAKIQSDVSQNPLVKQYLIEPIARWGKYDGSPEAQHKADEAMRTLTQKLFPASPHTMQLYRKALNANLYIPLAAAYAYAVGEYIDGGLPLSGAGTPEANQKVFMMRATYPGLYNLATTELTPKKSEAALCISANLLETFLDSDEIQRRFG